MESEENSTDVPGELIETLEDLNNRYADALMPMAFWLGLLAAIGIFGNILVIAVFSICPEYKNTKFKVFVLSLAIVDLLTCVSLLPADIVKTRHYFYFPDATPCKVKCFFNLFGQNASALVLLVICVDRYRKVCKPLKNQIWPETASKIVIGIMLLSFLLSVPAPILCGISSANKTNIHGTNTTVFFCAAEQRYHNSPFRYIYKIGLTVTLLAVSIAYIVMYSLILKTIIKHWRNVGSGGSVRFDSEENSGKSNKADTDKKIHVYPEEIKILVGVPPTGSKQSGIYGGEALMPIIHGYPNGIQNGGTTKNQSIHSSGSSKSKNSLRKSASLRSGSEYSLRACSLHRKSSVIKERVPYKTLIWIILTLVFIVTYFVNALLSFITTKLYELSPDNLLLYTFFFRIYFINNIINPIIYLCLDKRFKISCFHLVNLLKRKLRLLCN